MELREYQREAVEAVLSEWEQVRSTVCVAATGLGKTVLATDVIRRRREFGRVLWLAHRTELVEQAAETLDEFGLTVEVEKAGRFATARDGIFGALSDVVVASVASMHPKRRGRFGRDGFSTVIVDESHHSPAKTWRDVIGYFEHAKVLGLTATPDRGDGVGLGNVFDSVAYEADIRFGIRESWLVPIVQRRIECADLDISDLKTVKGDLEQTELQQRLSVEGVLHQVAGPLVEEAGDRPTLVFTAGVQQAHALADVLAEGYVEPHRVVAMDGETPDDTRKMQIERFKEGRVQFLINCGLFVEGFDARTAGCVAIAKPTKSRSAYTQVIGRGTRTLKGVVEGIDEPAERARAIAASAKPDCLVLDFVGNSGKHKLVTPADVLGGKGLPEDVVQDADREAAQEGVPVEVALQRAQERAEQRRARDEAERQRREREARLRAEVAYTAEDVDPFTVGATQTGPRATERQLATLKKLGFAVDKTPSRKEASNKIDQGIKRRERGLCTIKQARQLAKRGLRHEDVTFDEARWIMDQLASNGWRTPAEVQRRFGAEVADAAE